MRILLIEDDPMIGKAMRQGLADAGFTVDWVTDGGAAELALVVEGIDLQGARRRPRWEPRATRLVPALPRATE